jgi:uncharacterized membrane protein
MISNLAVSQILAIVIVMIILDGIWLTATNATTRPMFAALQGQPLKVRWIPTLFVYAIMVAALWYFAVAPSSTSVTDAMGRGAALGFSMYGLYDLTNYATLERYTLDFALTDMAWGTFLFTVTSAVAATIAAIKA